ncbi:MAG: PAS domain-containing protein [Ignavibacteria bacterium]|nr:PAS domain-containing protein [Ignavibacteria bacterium]MCU7503885.1 PAS domain-containing protein [Ignavibacteria bacterium]MCU7515894.1 PAS domain-containing protein [Ignavibacteria bacterium]
MEQNSKKGSLLFLSILATLCIFITDIFLPYSVGFLYVLPLLMIFWRYPRSYTNALAAVTSLLIMADMLIHSEYRSETVLISRWIEILLIWLIVLYLVHSRKHETTLRETNLLLQTISDNTNLLFLYLKNDFTIIRVNKAFARMFSEEESFFAGKNYFDFIEREDDKVLFSEVIKAKKPLYLQERPLCAPGIVEKDSNYWNWDLVPLFGTRGRVNGLIVSLLNVSGQIRSQSELRQSNRILKSVFSSLNEAVLLIDPVSQKVIDCNKAAEKILGYEKHELDNQDVKILHVNEEMHNRFLDESNEALGSKGFYETVFHLRRKNRDIFISEHYVNPIYDENGKLTLIVSVIRDITERKKAEGQIYNQKYRAEALAGISQKLNEVTLDYQAVLSVAVKYTAELIGDSAIIRLTSDDKKWIKPAAFYNSDCDKIKLLRNIFESDTQALDEGFAGYVIQTGEPVLIANVTKEKLISACDKEFFPYSENYRTFSFLMVPLRVENQLIGTMDISRDEPGHPYSLDDQFFLQNIADRIALAIFNARLYSNNLHEIHVRKQTELTLRQKEELLAEAQRLTHLGSYQYNITKNSLNFSDELFRIFGMEPSSESPAMEEVKSRVMKEDLEVFKRTLKEPLESKKSFEAEYRLILSDGTQKHVLCKSKPVINDSGRMDEVLGAVLDITERKKSEEELRHTLTELERSNKDLEQFAYVASHDLQEPLRMVSNFTQLFARRYRNKLDSNADEFIEFIVEGAMRMQHLIRDLLLYSRLSARNGSFGPVDCNKVMQKVLSNLRLFIQENQASISFERLPVISANSMQIEQLFSNLIINAIKFHDHDKPKVSISCSFQNKDWLFSIKDNGIGIEPDYHERIFVIFQRLHERGEYPGTGIGLAICKKVVEHHGGRIWVDSEQGKGSTFYFTIPELQQTSGR